MERFLYIFRLNLGLVLIATSLFWASPWKELGVRGLASEAPSCADAMEALIREGREFAPRGKALQDKIPEYEAKMEELEELIFTPKNFGRDHYREHGQNPTLRELIEKIIVGHRTLVLQIQKLGDAHPQVKYFVDETVKSLRFTDKEKANIQEFIGQNRDLLDKRFNIGKATTEEEKEMRRALEGIWKNPYGDFGELKAAIHFQGVEAQNLHLRLHKIKAIGPQIEFHQNKIVDATTAAIEQLENASPEALARYRERFPAIFSGNRAEDLDAVKQWLESKEVDLITKGQNGRYYFIEVKNYDKPLDYETLMDGFKGKKSVMEQQIEMKEILEFLELDAFYSPAITLLKGVKPEAREALEGAGIMVVDYP